jgi:hypothetical protein
MRISQSMRIVVPGHVLRRGMNEADAASAPDAPLFLTIAMYAIELSPSLHDVVLPAENPRGPALLFPITTPKSIKVNL